MLQPCDKIHTYGEEDLVEFIKEMYQKMILLGDKMDEVLDHTSHLPNFRYKCKIFITMSGEIDKLTMVAVHNLKAQGKIKR